MSKNSAATAAHPASTAEAWESTRALTVLATQFVDEDDYLAQPRGDVGRKTGADTHELFVSCDPAQALQQQFEHLQPDFIAVHDLGTASSAKLLAGLAAASARKVQRLVIRRQGYGHALATMAFVELPTTQGPPLRLYATDADADTVTRHALVRTLLGFSRLGVVMVGDLPSHAIETALRPIREAMTAGPWANRHLLLLPLAAASTLGIHGQELAAVIGVDVRTTPQVTRPADAWKFINASWSRLGQAGAATGSTAPAQRQPAYPAMPVPARPTAATAGMRPMPPTSRREPAPEAPPVDILERYLAQLRQLAGMLSCCIFEVATGREVAHAGEDPGGTPLALHGTQLLTAMGIASRSLGFGQALPEAAVTLGSRHLLLREVPRHPHLALHAVLDRTTANLTLVRLQIERLDALFDEKSRRS